MKNFCLLMNPEKERADEIAAFITSYLGAHGASCEIRGDHLKKDALAGKTDCVITLGGDGTIIRAAREIAGTGIPIMGINLGHMGYMTVVGKKEEIPDALDSLLQGRAETEQRMMLEGTVTQGGKTGKPEISLNEIVITRKNTIKTIRFRISVNGQFLNEYSADGIIIATPTGSTAYNLSAGGPIVDPGARMTILTPICPHALSKSSIVLKAEDELDIYIPQGGDGEQTAVFDGDAATDLVKGAHVAIRESKLTTPFIRLANGTFLDRLRSKMTIL